MATESFDLSGEWHGYYEQGGCRHGISMRLTQHGTLIAGTMRDQDTLMMGGLPAGDAQDLRAMFEASGDAEPEVITRLPAESTIRGQADGPRVAFEKRYLGAQQTAVWLDDVQVEIEIQGHRVHYRGVVEQGGALLRGEWRLDPLASDDDAGAQGSSDRGAFVLQRAPARPS